VVGKPCQGTCGDANGDGSVDISDADYLINIAFGGGPAPLPTVACGDANTDASVDASDSVYIINFIFAGGPSPGNCSPGSWGNDNCCRY